MKSKRVSIFWLIISFIVISTFSIFVINNIITVNNLIREISLIKEDAGLIIQLNNTLKLEIEKLSSFDRVKNLAETKIGLKINENALVKNKNFKISKKRME